LLDPVIVTLRTPIAFGQETITELKIRPMSGKDMRGLPDGNRHDTMLALAARLSGRSPAVIDQLTGMDLMDVIRACGAFFEASPENGTGP
jgi:hypothetical protein